MLIEVGDHEIVVPHVAAVSAISTEEGKDGLCWYGFGIELTGGGKIVYARHAKEKGEIKLIDRLDEIRKKGRGPFREHPDPDREHEAKQLEARLNEDALKKIQGFRAEIIAKITEYWKKRRWHENRRRDRR